MAVLRPATFSLLINVVLTHGRALLSSSLSVVAVPRLGEPPAWKPTRFAVPGRPARTGADDGGPNPKVSAVWTAVDSIERTWSRRGDER